MSRASKMALALLLFLLMLMASRAQADGAVLVVLAQSSPAIAGDSVAPLIVDGQASGDVFGLGQSVEIRGRVEHGAMAFGGDVIVTGRVEGDVATIGGSVIQREGSFIGGDVIVIGGADHHGKSAPGRTPQSTTIMIAGYEEELREAMRDPSTLLTPRWSLLYAGMRVLAVLFWFIVSLALTSVTPGAVSRAAARLQLTNMRVAVIGFLGAIVVSFGVPLSLRVLPPMGSVLGVITAVLFWFIVSRALASVTPGAVSRAAARLQLTNMRVAVIGFLGAIVVSFGVPLSLRVLPTMVSVLGVITAVLFLTVAYLFGRVVINAATGKWLQRLIWPEGKHSESVALLLGAGFWAIMLSLPYVWPLLVAGLVVTSLGLALTARYRVGWKRTPIV